jgi:choline-sulfatase
MCIKTLLPLIVFALFPFRLQAQSQQQNDTATRPNILIIMTDHWFSDAMSCVIGDEYIDTPNIDSLAANGMLFSRAYCANPICQPSRTSTFTGRYPHETGVQNNDKVGVDTDRFPIMGKIFMDAGYDTGYSGKTHIRFSKSPNNSKFSEADKHIHGFDFLYQGRVNAADSPRKGDFGRVWPGMQFLKQKRDKPFLLVVSCMNPHNICEWARKRDGHHLPDGPIGDPPPLDELPPLRANHLPPEGETEVMAYMRRSYQRTSTFPVGNYDEKTWREYIWAYYRMIEKVDGEIGKLLAVLRETGQEENTLVVFTSDHGDGHSAHKWNQKTVLSDESARVPFILSWKGKTPKGTSDILVNTGVDPFVTLCDFAGIEPPAGMPGKSLKAPALGYAADWSREYIVVQNYMTQGAGIGGETKEERRANRLTPFGRMVRSDRYKYCVYSDDKQERELVDLATLTGERRELERQRMLLRTIRQESLIDIQNDPGEMKNLAKDPAYKEVLQQHRRYLEEFCQEHGDTFSAPRGQ